MTLAIDIIEWTQGIEVYIHDKIYGKIVKNKIKKMMVPTRNALTHV